MFGQARAFRRTNRDVAWFAHADPIVEHDWLITTDSMPPRRGSVVIAMALDERTARHIVGMHNAWLCQTAYTAVEDHPNR